EKEVTVAQTVPLLTSSFTLPCAFSSRSDRVSVVVTGDCATEPVISVQALEDLSFLSLRNEATGAEIKIECPVSAGDTVTVDIKSRRIESAQSGSFLSYLSADSYLGSFKLEEGENEICVSADGAVCATLSYSNLFREAMY
ncbi:MAG: phage tail family protein, partial [Clostridia bacterium]|nr:phage tail family protein [Clostridia bacterium]